MYEGNLQRPIKELPRKSRDSPLPRVPLVTLLACYWNGFA